MKMQLKYEPESTHTPHTKQLKMVQNGAHTPYIEAVLPS